MIIIGITGAIGHGKTSLAEALIKAQPNSKHIESYHVIAEVADAFHNRLKKPPKPGDYRALNNWLEALPKIIKQVTNADCDFKNLQITPAKIANAPLDYQKLFQHLDSLQADPELARAKITDENKPKYRAILQWLGGYLVTYVGPTIWWHEIIKRCESFKSKDVKLVVLSGVRYPSDADTVRKAGGNIVLVTRPDEPEADLQDPTERDRQQISPDATLINNGSLKDLLKLSRLIIEDLQNDQLKDQYMAVVK